MSEETHQLIIADAWINIGRETVWRKTQSSSLKKKTTTHTHTHDIREMSVTTYVCNLLLCGLQNSLQHLEGYTRMRRSSGWDDTWHSWKPSLNARDLDENYRGILLKNLEVTSLNLSTRDDGYMTKDINIGYALATCYK